MRLIMLRHGEPNYQKDCLTERGRRQAEAAAERLAREGITEIYASPMGRAAETASFTAKRCALPVETLEYMHEISWGGEGVPDEGHPWDLSYLMIAEENFEFLGDNWRQHRYFRHNEATAHFDRISAQFDAFLEARGYRHEGRRFFCTAEENRTIALFSHGGSGACVLAHLLSLPFPYVLTVMPYDFTSIIILEFPHEPGQYVHPRLELFNDVGHLAGAASGPVFQREPD